MSFMTQSPQTRYVLLDFETTGLDPESSEIIEIGAILCEGFTEVSRYHTLVKPSHEIPRMISDLTGITNEMVADAPTLKDVAVAFAEYLEQHPIVAHNSSLEQGFLDHHLSPLVSGIAYTVHNSIDPLALLLPDQPSHSMESLRKWAGVDLENSHRADKDCQDLLKILIYAHDWMITHRPWMGALSDELLPSWWWNWFFEGALATLEERPSVLDLLQRPYLGDLREMEKSDEEIKIPESLPISKDAVQKALHGEGLIFRESQAQMAEKIRVALEKGEKVAIEAPTGTGKSVAYLVPGVLASRETHAPLVVSTHSKALQDQLYEKDLPLVGKILGEIAGSPTALKATTVKGQENYLCLRKLYGEIQFLPDSDSASALEERYAAAFIVALAHVSKTAELDRVSQYLRNRFSSMNSFIERVRSHHTTTLGPPCKFYKSCHYFDSARIAHQSDVVIANHSLIFHWPEHLPKLRNVVFDEAHHLEDQLTDAFSLELRETDLADQLERLGRKGSSRRDTDGVRLDRFLRDLKLPHGPSGEQSLEPYIEGLKTRVRELTSILQSTLSKKGGRDTGGYEDFLDLSKYSNSALLDGVKNLSSRVQALLDYFGSAQKAISGGPLKTDPAADLLSLYQFRFSAFDLALKKAIEEGDGSKNWLRLLYWHPRETLWRFEISPIEVKSLGHEFFEELRSVTLTSATLSSGTHPTFVTDRIGVELTHPFVSLPSPYALADQAIAFIPSDISQPGTPAHLEALIQFTEGVALTLGGRTMLLMTANHRLKHAAEELRRRLEKHGISVFDSLTDRRAIDSFRATDRALLIGSERYGEGVDIPGKQLSCVIIEKINEAMTRGPLQDARKNRTKFALFDYDFPLRMMWLKQRVGRLIRAPSDRGAIVVFDPRFHAWSPPSQAHVVNALKPIPVRGGTRDDILMRIEKMGL
jgi:ATP-dependent DNA helicase DinG